MSLCGIKIARVYEVQRSSSVPLYDSDDDIQESIWYWVSMVRVNACWQDCVEMARDKPSSQAHTLTIML
jgi:hypothetical protein